MAKYALLIQGPLLSIGKAGHIAEVKKRSLGKDEFISYDCRNNISKLVSDFGDLFDRIVVSTWENEVKAGDVWPGVEIVAEPDPGEVKRDEYVPRSINKYRQFIGIQNGLKVLKNSSIDYVVRIRTDQYLDLRELISLLNSQEEKNDTYEKIFVPFVRRDDFFVHDIYLAGTVQGLEKFCEAMIAYKKFEFIWCVHREMVLKHAFVNYKEYIKVKDSDYFTWWPSLGSSKATKKIFSFMFDNIFVPFPPAVFRTVVWRGTKLSEEHIRLQKIDSESTSVRKNLVNVPSFISTNWRRYYEFFHHNDNKPVSTRNKLVTIIARTAWEFWKLVRQLSKALGFTKFIYYLHRKVFS